MAEILQAKAILKESDNKKILNKILEFCLIEIKK